jgi:hypothetical protein
MTPVEAAQLLTVVSKADNRQVDADTVRIWHTILQHVELADAIQAVRDHLASSTEYLMPIHVIRGVKAILAGQADLHRAGHVEHALPPAALAEAEPGDNRRGVLIVNYVLAGLARTRRECGWLSRVDAEETGSLLMREALDRWPADGPVLPRRGVPCGRPACRCTHDLIPGSVERCDGGWIEVMPPARKPDPVLIGEPDPVREDPDTGRVRRCPSCDPIGAEITAKVNGRRQALAALRLRH